MSDHRTEERRNGHKEKQGSETPESGLEGNSFTCVEPLLWARHVLLPHRGGERKKPLPC